MRGVRTIKSRASVRSRERHGRLPAVVGVPPVKVYGPEFAEGFWLEGYYAYGYLYSFKTAPGMTVVAWPGDWDNTGGATTVVGQFHLYDPQTDTSSPVGSPGDTELVIAEGMLGKYLSYVVTATRGGVSLEVATEGIASIEVTDQTETLARFNYGKKSEFQFWYPGQAITKPAYDWFTQPEFGSYTQVGEWWKNGAPTGVSTETYSDTQEGDIVIWIEKAVNGVGIEATMPATFETTELTWAGEMYWKCVVNTKCADIVQGSQTSIESRINGLTGGAANMNLFTTRDPVAPNYVFNENCWVYDLLGQLSAIPVGFCQGNRTGRSWQVPGGWGASYGPILITPRHVLTSGHTQFAAGSGAPRIPTYTLRWMLADGKLVEANVIGGNYYPDNNKPFHVGLLDRDIQAEGVHVIPALDMSAARSEVGNMQFFPPIFGRSQAANDRFGPHQEQQFEDYADNWQGNDGYQPPSDYPKLHDAMFWNHEDGFRYSVWGGDSGTPMMSLINDTVYLKEILSGGAAYDTAGLDYIDNLIADCDALAVQRGVLQSPTGYTIKRSQNHTNPNLLLLSEAEPISLLVSEADPTPLFAIPD